MRFSDPLVPGRLIQRYKRFLADIELVDGTIVTAHCANSGAMTGVAAPGTPVWLSPNRSPTAKLAWRWELAEVDGGLVGINTQHPNGIVAEAIAAGAIPELAGYDSLRREVKYGVNSRIDLLLSSDARPTCYVEVKNVHLRRGRLAAFPDAVTARGTKHLAELSAMVALGFRAVMVYLVQRSDCDRLVPADDVDPGYGRGVRAAVAAGVETLAYTCKLSVDGIEVDRPIPVDLTAAVVLA